MKLSLVVPCFNEARAIPFFREAVRALRLPYDLEFVFVNDGSTDESLTVLRQLAKADPAVHYLSFSRNFGKEAALLAGLRRASSEWIVTLDVDLQHPVTLLPEMAELLERGEADCVAARRTTHDGEAVGGWPTLACLILFLGGLQLFVIGIHSTSLAKHFRRRFYGE